MPIGESSFLLPWCVVAALVLQCAISRLIIIDTYSGAHILYNVLHSS